MTETTSIAVTTDVGLSDAATMTGLPAADMKSRHSPSFDDSF